ncbi:MAG: hypothetical protein JRE20_01990 [Deltaproteobacteria bacterium]|nr:hypothetical protein [Deltaproteobacteria bacterium]
MKTTWEGMKMKKIILVVSLTIFLAACGKPISVETKETLKAPVDCSTAEGDLRVLESEKANVAKRMAMGVSSITPIGLVVGVVTRTQRDKMKVAIGKYNTMIDEKIAEIKEECGIE